VPWNFAGNSIKTCAEKSTPVITAGASSARYAILTIGRRAGGAHNGAPLKDTETDLAALLARVSDGDQAAFRALYGRTSAKLFASVRRILGNNAAAEDAVQEAYVRVWRRAGDFDANVGSPIAWMTTIARHAAIDIVRKSAERVSAVSDELDPELADRSAGGGPLAASGLAACLDGIEPDRRNMVLLAYCYGWSREELSRRFDRPVATVKTLLRRSLLALKECLGD
jgi:RNA polymerase sigma-70 factor, ECF subfamily